MDLGRSVSCSVIHLCLGNGDFPSLVINDFAQRLAGVDMLPVACPVDGRLLITQGPPLSAAFHPHLVCLVVAVASAEPAHQHLTLS